MRPKPPFLLHETVMSVRGHIGVIKSAVHTMRGWSFWVEWKGDLGLWRGVKEKDLRRVEIVTVLARIELDDV